MELEATVKIKLAPEISQFSCEGCIKFSVEMDCECDCEPGKIFVVEGEDG